MESLKFVFPNSTVNAYGRYKYYAGDANFDQNLKQCKEPWHLIKVFKKNIVKKDILQAFVDIAEDDEFIPVGYIEEPHVDNFLLFQSWEVINKIFQRKLYIFIRKTKQLLKLEVWLNASTYILGQPSPIIKLQDVVEAQYRNMKRNSRILELQNINEHPLLAEFYINLRIKSVFVHLIKCITNFTKFSLNSINGINLSSNRIKTLSVFTLLENIKLKVIILTNNEIDHLEELQFLRQMRPEELYLAGNPVCNNPDFIAFTNRTFLGLQKSDFTTSRLLSPCNNYPSSIIKSQMSQNILVSSLDELQKFKNSHDWHQITVEHEGYFKKEEIIDEFFELFSAHEYRNEFYICYYKSNPTEDCFLVRDCYEYLATLIQYDLKLKISLSSLEPLPLRIIMNFCRFEKGQVEPEKLLLAFPSANVYNPLDRSLNLENFNSKPEMRDVYVNFAKPSIYKQILRFFLQKYFNQIITVNLSFNKISNCKGLKGLHTSRNLKTLLLSGNRIRYVRDLDCISKIDIEDLSLDGNPLCSKYTSPTDYIKDCMDLFPKLKKLDGISLDQKDSPLFNSKKNFLCSLQAYDFSEQFVEHFFRIYDTKNRRRLSEMYSMDALFTMCFAYQPKERYESRRLEIYQSLSRNLLQNRNAFKNIFFNEQNIMNVFINLPETEHDFYSFTTDTVMFQENMTVITITGLFKDNSYENLYDTEIIMGFSRTFILKQTMKGAGLFEQSFEYEIVNEQLTIFNPTENMLKTAFKYTTIETNPSLIYDPQEKAVIMKIFHNMTKLKKFWMTKFLTEADWKLDKALEYFVSKVKNNNIPLDAFVTNKTNNSVE